MLYEFYSTQKTKKPGSVNATYLLNGVPEVAKEPRVNGHQKDGEDTHMQSSPYMSSSAPQQDDQEEAAPSISIVLANEEDLEGMLSTQLVGWVYFTAFETCAAEKGVSGKGNVQANILNTYL